MRQYLGLAVILLAGLAQSVAHAGTMTFAAQNASGASVAPFTLLSVPNPSGQTSVNLGNGVTATFTPNNATPKAGVYSGNTPNIAASPFSGTNLTPTNYIAAEPNNPVIISFSTPQTNFDLLWGSVDTFNSLSIAFCNTSGCSSPKSISGQDVATAAGISANGTTSAFVEVYNTTAFNSVTLATTGIAFEFVPAVPEPVTLGILGTGIVGLVLAKRRRQQLTKR